MRRSAASTEDLDTGGPCHVGITMEGEVVQPYERLVRVVQHDDINARCDYDAGQRRHELMISGPQIALPPKGHPLADVAQTELEGTGCQGYPERFASRPPVHGRDHISSLAQAKALMDEVVDDLPPRLAGKGQLQPTVDHPFTEAIT